MATKALTHRGAHHWRAPATTMPSDILQVLLAVALWVVLLSLLILLVGGLVSWVFTTYGNTAFLRGEGVGASLPLDSLATFMTFTMLPAFMPLLLPLVAVVLLFVLPFSSPAKEGYSRVRKAWAY